MRLEEFKRERAGARPAFMLPLDVGRSKYELAISGPGPTVKKMFAEADIEVTIDPKGTQDTFSEQVRRAARDVPKSGGLSLEAIEAGMKKKRAPERTLAKSVFATLQRVEGDGTFFFLALGGLAIPAGFSLFVFLPPVWSCRATVTPLTGDQDLMLLFSWPPWYGGPISSAFGGTTTDVVSFGVPPFPGLEFVPVIRLIGFTTGICRTFSIIAF